MKEITIILTNRNTLEFLKLAIESIRKNKAASHELIIMDDNSTDGSKEWLRDNSIKYRFAHHTHDDLNRHGIVGMVDEGISLAKNEIVYILHSDMYVAKGFDENLIRHLKPKTLLCSTRIEPPLHPPEKCKITQTFGVFPHEFNEKAFDVFVEQIKTQNKYRITNGIFAPVMVYKKDWPGHNKLFYPQSIEDSEMWYRAKQQGYRFVQAWDSLVYHFTSRGSRFNNETKTTLKDSEEWKKGNKKNLKNFIRLYGTTPLYTETKEPVIIPKTPISAHVLACERDVSYVYNFLDQIEPYFDEIVFVIDRNPTQQTVIKKALDDSLDNSIIGEIKRYNKDILANGPTNFEPQKIRIFERLLNNDFAAQTNFAVEKCSNDWTMKIDLDEKFSDGFLNHIKQAILEAEKQNKTVIGFPRVNTVNGAVVNDIPREQWTEDNLKTHRRKQETRGKMAHIKNPDIQFRLHKKNIRWFGAVHEMPEPVIRKDESSVLVSEIHFEHPKTLDRQTSQNKMYSEIGHKKPIKSLIYDSVIYTTEGITKHAREEIKELGVRGYKVQILDQYRFNANIEGCEKFKKYYDPVDIQNEAYAVICNQPPDRWNKSINLKNFIGFLAFEGYIPENWVKTINDSRVREVWTPSEYCKQCFKKSGVTKPMYVIPHGIDPAIWKPVLNEPEKNKPFTFLWTGTSHNSRKGMDLMVKAFSKAFGPEDNVRLLLKVNKIYDRTKETNKLIHKNVDPAGNKNIFFIDDEMTEDEMVLLMNRSNVYVSPHRSEGFGINILQAMACGTVSIVTKATGNMDFWDDRLIPIEIEKDERWAPFSYPYINTQWPEPKLEHLIEQLKNAYQNFAEHQKKALALSAEVRNKWTWQTTVNKIEERLKTLSD
ncbi:MAG: glycosyltransferase [bacterium]|nr:glycosyltransferase [bacterium]